MSTQTSITDERTALLNYLREQEWGSQDETSLSLADVRWFAKQQHSIVCDDLQCDCFERIMRRA